MPTHTDPQLADEYTKLMDVLNRVFTNTPLVASFAAVSSLRFESVPIFLVWDCEGSFDANQQWKFLPYFPDHYTPLTFYPITASEMMRVYDSLSNTQKDQFRELIPQSRRSFFWLMSFCNDRLIEIGERQKSE